MTRITRWNLDGELEPNRPHARDTDPDTSHEATHFDPTLTEKAVIDAIYSVGEDGMTCYEVIKATGLPVQTVSPRFCPLHEKRILVYHTDPNSPEQYLKRPGHSGRRQLVHFINRKLPK